MSANPYQPPSATVADPVPPPGIEVSWTRAAKVWWSLMWRLVLLGAIAGGLLGFVIGFFMGVAGTPQQTIATVTTWAGVVIAIPVGIWIVRNVLQKSWEDFRIALVPVSRQ